MSVHRRPYRTLDGYVAILPCHECPLGRVLRRGGAAGSQSDARFRTMADRTKNIDDTYAETAKIMATRTTDEWLELFARPACRSTG
jgi:crotonobetainyl-CoA:carnitine CoA-transferase CaiB-like acyl-CoA transferase